MSKRAFKQWIKRYVLKPVESASAQIKRELAASDQADEQEMEELEQWFGYESDEMYEPHFERTIPPELPETVYAFNQPHPSGGNVYVTMTESQAIEWTRANRPEYKDVDDQRVLGDFIAVHWAAPIKS